ncbi:antibiotic biosynthesis monooxygenase family protein [Janibacter limosus]|uniref:Antibiotic biosynthesis monooxygenase n=1 Tax=Janibacter limosus TaxID=53458 RepID=A0A4P6MTP9_9MICO|nr:antibiotic biosynthesis monooxygenase [Janibacter limosus]QBF45097.1 antibiotic biosynthesis monooxygenase [Janibacter limosus]
MSIVKINAISVPEQAREEMERRFAARQGTVDKAPGFEGFQLLRPTEGGDRYFVVTRWADEESFAAWRDGDARAAHSGEAKKPVATGAELLGFDVVIDVPAPTAE